MKCKIGENTVSVLFGIFEDVHNIVDHHIWVIKCVKDDIVSFGVGALDNMLIANVFHRENYLDSYGNVDWERATEASFEIIREIRETLKGCNYGARFFTGGAEPFSGIVPLVVSANTTYNRIMTYPLATSSDRIYHLANHFIVLRTWIPIIAKQIAKKIESLLPNAIVNLESMENTLIRFSVDSKNDWDANALLSYINDYMEDEDVVVGYDRDPFELVEHRDGSTSFLSKMVAYRLGGQR